MQSGPVHSWLARECVLAASSSVILGLTVIVGWHANLESLIQINTAFAPMQYNTALGFLLIGLAMLGRIFKRYLTAQILGSLVAVIGLLTLVEYGLSLNLGIDQLFMEHYITIGSSNSGRMAPNTALNFLISGTAILISLRITKPIVSDRILGISGGIVIALGLIAFLGYVGNLPAAYGWGRLTQMAVHTSVGFVVVGLGLFFIALRSEIIIRERRPKWLAFSAGLGLVTLSVAMWQALSAEMASMNSWLPSIVGITGIVSSILLATTIWLAETSRTHAISLIKVNTELNQWKLLFQHAGWGAVLADKDSLRLLLVNSAFAEMHGYTRTEAEALAIPDLYSDNEKDSVVERITMARETGHVVNEGIHVRKDGSQFPVSIDKIAICDEQENILYFGANYQDISNRKKTESEKLTLERQMQEAQKLESLGVLAGGIAHDFNNLLMSILGNADIALDDLPPYSPARESIDTIVTTAHRAADLAKQMLAYSGKGRFIIESVDMNSLIQEMTHLLNVSISKSAVLKCDFGENIQNVSCDVTQIRQVIMNLIINSSEAIGEKPGVISISTGEQLCDREYLDRTERVVYPAIDDVLSEGRYVFLEVSDNGCGMSRNTQSKLFDPFFTTKFSGRGLGMSAILGIIRGHHGTIKVYSEVGKGTTVKVLFPVTEEDSSVASVNKTRERVVSWNACGKMILVADDDESVLSVTRRYLERIGFIVLSASDGQEAVDAFKQHAATIECILLDLTMPNMDGKEAFRQIREIREDARVILCSGYNEQETTQFFVGKGLADFIQKPFRLADLGEKLRTLLSPVGEEGD